MPPGVPRVVAFLALGLVLGVSAIDVSWIPADPEGPLPLSAAYREQLGRLCHRLASGQPLPPEVRSRSAALTKLCQQLVASEVDPPTEPNVLPVLFLLFVLGGMAYLFYGWRGLQLRSIGGQRTAVQDSNRGVNPSTGDEVRAMRLRRFAPTS
eukprot:EG_transcript_34409